MSFLWYYRLHIDCSWRVSDSLEDRELLFCLKHLLERTETPLISTVCPNICLTQDLQRQTQADTAYWTTVFDYSLPLCSQQRHMSLGHEDTTILEREEGRGSGSHVRG